MIKKLFNIFLCLVITLTSFIGLIQYKVNAATNDSNIIHYWLPGYFSQKNNDGKYSQLAYIYANGEIAYCVEPGIPLENGTFSSSSNFNIANISEEKKHKLELIAAFGYNLTNHRYDTYYAATQELIWRELGVNTLTWHTDKQGGGTFDLTRQKNDIMNSVNNYSKNPSFYTGGEIKINVGNTTLTDSNGVLNNYEIISSNADDAKINGNQLNIYNKTSKDVNIIIRRKNMNTGTSLVYYANEQQTVATFRISDPKIVNFKFKVVGGSLELQKKDKDTDTATPQGDATLEGAKFELLDENKSHVDYFTTNGNGKFKTDKILIPDKKYYVKEVEASKGYLVNPQEYEITATDSNLELSLDVPEEVIKRKIEFFKVFASDETGIMTGEPNVQFDIILKSSGQKVATLTTDDRGYMSTVLPYGTYIVKQITSTKDHEKVDDFEIVVNSESDDVIYKVLSNAEIKARVKVIKVDQDEKVIPYKGIKFKIKNIDTNEYVCQTVSYPTVQKYCEYETDENGILITPYPLNSGNYQLEELDQIINGYVWNKAPLQFSISDNVRIESTEDFEAIVEVKFTNQEVKGAVEINKVGEEVKIEDGTYTYEEIPLQNVKFGLYDEEGNLIKEDLTNEEGYLKFDDLKLGKYVLKELETIDSHVLNEEEYEFELVYKDQYTPIVTKSFNLKNYLKKGGLEFTKTDLTSGKVIPNVKVDIYTEDDELVYSGKTDENGKIKIDNLFLGKYYIIETEAATGYRISDEKVYFEIKENGEVVKAAMTNEKYKGTLDFKKEDFSSDKGLPNTLIEIYNAKTNELVFSGRTDENGKIIIEELEYGKYYILEKEAPEGYTLNSERMYFEILEDGQIVKAVMKDEKIVIDVPITGLNKKYIIEISIITLFVIGIGFIIYDKKRKH